VPLSDSASKSPADALTSWLAIPIERWYREVAEANPHRCQHRGPCGVYLFCDREEHRAGGYRTVELLDSGTILAHCEGLTLHPNDPEYRARHATLTHPEIA
jgi:hypothetical protein